MCAENRTDEPDETEELPLFDDEDFDKMGDDFEAETNAWGKVVDTMMKIIEDAHDEIDKHWPMIPQGKLPERIRKLKEHLYGGGF